MQIHLIHTGFDIDNSETLKVNQKADSLRFPEKGNAAFQTLRYGAFDYIQTKTNNLWNIERQPPIAPT